MAQKDFADYQTMLDSIQGVREAIKKSPDVIGPVAGRVNTLKQVFGQDPEGFTELQTRVQQVINTLVYLRTGKQMNEHEALRMEKELTNVNQPLSVFQTRLDEAERLMTAAFKNRRETIPGGVTPPPPAVSGAFTLEVGGKTITFPNAAALDGFKKAAGIP